MREYNRIQRRLARSHRSLSADGGNRIHMNVLVIGSGGREHALVWKNRPVAGGEEDLRGAGERRHRRSRRMRRRRRGRSRRAPEARARKEDRSHRRRSGSPARRRHRRSLHFEGLADIRIRQEGGAPRGEQGLGEGVHDPVRHPDGGVPRVRQRDLGAQGDRFDGGALCRQGGRARRRQGRHHRENGPGSARRHRARHEERRRSGRPASGSFWRSS